MDSESIEYDTHFGTWEIGEDGVEDNTFQAAVCFFSSSFRSHSVVPSMATMACMLSSFPLQISLN